MNQTIDLEKYLSLSNKFAIHEEWIQQGCPADKTPSSTVPGYLALASQNIEAYAFYRRSLLPYLSQARGNQLFFKEFCQIITECKQKHAEDMIQFEQFHNAPSEKFKGQWANLFDRFIDTNLNHTNCYKYLQKYEVEYFLVVLAQLRQISSGNGFDDKLHRFLDRTGNFKKGVLANYIVDGFQGYLEVKKMLTKAYNAKLRNIIGHNNYKIAGVELTSLEEDYTITKKNFFESYLCLQEIQNAILWLLLGGQSKNNELCQFGVTSVGFDVKNSDSQDSKIYIFQINSFRIIDPKADWIKTIQFELKGEKLITTLSEVDAHHGIMTQELGSFLKKVDAQGQVHVSIVPVMPCFHEGCQTIETAWGTFCQYDDQFDIVAQAVVKWG